MGYAMGSFFIIPLVIFYLAIIGLSIYIMVLTIGFLKKGTQAFDTYIRNNQVYSGSAYPQNPEENRQ